jgi:hypothetical protein
MSYHDVEPSSRAERVGKTIYMATLAGRRGFRDDQLGISDPEIWAEIFAAIGKTAIDAVNVTASDKD